MTKMAKRKQHKHFGIKLNIHPAHFHLSVLVALAMIFITAAKGSAEMIHTAYEDADHNVTGESTEMREAETRHDIAMISSARFATHSGAE